MVPTVEHDIGGDRSRVLEKPVRRAPRDNSLPPGEHSPSGRGMECEGQQIEARQDGGEGFPAVPEIMFEVVPVGFLHIEGFVFDPRLRRDKPSTVPVHKLRILRRWRT